MDLTIRRMHAIFNAGVINNDMWLGQPDESHFRALCEQIGVIGAYDYALYSSLVDHMIAANALLTQGSPEQVARYRDEVIQMRAVYAFGCTEIASGTDVRNLKTTVTYDPARHCLVLDSPCAGACNTGSATVCMLPRWRWYSRDCRSMAKTRGTTGFAW